MQTIGNKISMRSRVFMVLASAALIVSLFVPIWSIDLDAPQYPEGLNLKIHANKIGGNVEIVNGLNHYIGMKTLHTEDFIEFTILPWLIAGFALLSLLVAISGKRNFLNGVLMGFVLFGVVSMIDFWRWEYNYGHDLDPNAAIVVPGMAYQPPLIGFKQLLNFGAYSMPDIGGWLFLLAGLLMLVSAFLENKSYKALKRSAAPAAVLLLLFFSSCDQKPQAVRLNKDNCSYCEMTISDLRFAAELITDKGKIYKFDDLSCMLSHMNENSEQKYKGIYISDFLAPNTLSDVNTMTLIKGEHVGSPMGGNMAAFSNPDSAAIWEGRLGAEKIEWSSVGPAATR